MNSMHAAALIGLMTMFSVMQTPGNKANDPDAVTPAQI